MKLSENTINIMKNFSTINPSLLVNPGSVLTTITPGNSIYAKATVEENFPRQFTIYELSKFLGIISLFKEPEINFGEHQMTIISGRQSVNYTYADISTIVAPPQNKTISISSAEIEFSIAQEELQRIVRATGVLQLPNIAVTGDGKTINMTATNSKNPTTDVFSIEVGETDKSFNMIFKVEAIIKLIPASYDVRITSKGISHFSSNNIEYFIATDPSSNYNS
jgi:hypothetical protein